ncbi:DUF2917 domain-containing protein [Noviherbaspirillum sp.]|uniref:DUF2917 domain-containing protein n=1 Tax=Noviherbaspirillum sp. TaxID=1926288 RepID=UPI002FE291AC
MRALFTNEFLTVPSGHAVSGIVPAAQTLRLLRGRAWVTVEGQSHDYWLFAGDRLNLAPGHLVVVEADAAHGCVELKLEQPKSMTGGIIQRIRAMAGGLGNHDNRAPAHACASAQCSQS